MEMENTWNIMVEVWNPRDKVQTVYIWPPKYQGVAVQKTYKCEKGNTIYSIPQIKKEMAPWTEVHREQDEVKSSLKESPMISIWLCVCVSACRS